MGVRAVYPRPHSSIPNPQHTKYPYRLRNLEVTRPNQVWSAAITDVPLPLGFMYLVAVIDGFSRFVLTWQLSNTLDSFNTDQGVQFTAHAFTDELEAADIRISRDGRGRAFDNIFVERLWRTVKYEDLYIKGYATVPALESGLEDYFQFYNYQRPHQSLGYGVPADAYFAVNVPDPGVSDPP